MTETNDTAKALSFLDMFKSRPAQELVGNLQTRVGVQPFGSALLPITINSDTSKPTCYLCCPSAAYIDYARDELRHFSDSERLSGFLDLLLKLGYPLIRSAQLDRQVQLNNWLLATNPLPDLASETLRRTTQELADANPGHVVVWRSLNDYGDKNALNVFRQAGYRLYPARQIYLLDCREIEPRIGRDERRDRALLASGKFKLVASDEFCEEDYARAQVLYRNLYLEKYTWLNPQYTALFMKSTSGNGILEFQGLRATSGELAGVIAFFDCGRTMTAPIVGYDSTLPQATGLYRMLMALAAKRARTRKMLYNMSAGAASFKRNRGGIPAIEYSAIYNARLSPKHRLAALLVRKILDWVGVPVLRSFEL